MIYYKVKPEYDNKKRYAYNRKRGGLKIDGIWIANELYTGKELHNYCVNLNETFDKVEISKRKIYFMFGARFA